MNFPDSMTFGDARAFVCALFHPRSVLRTSPTVAASVPLEAEAAAMK